MKSNSQHSCSHCAMAQICLPLGVDKRDIEQLESLIQTSTTLHEGDVVVRQGEVFKKIYAVKSGILKSIRVDEDGSEYVIGFHLPGELVGLDGIYPEQYSATTSALSPAVLCEMNYDSLTELCTSIPALQRQLLRLLSQEIHESYVSSAESAEQTAVQKLAGFINNLSVRYEVRGYSASDLMLAMSRQDIANHLGLTPATVSRILKRLKQDGLLEIENRRIVIQKPTELKALIGCH